MIAYYVPISSTGEESQVLLFAFKKLISTSWTANKKKARQVPSIPLNHAPAVQRKNITVPQSFQTQSTSLKESFDGRWMQRLL